MNAIDEQLQILFPEAATRNKIYAAQKLLSYLIGTALGAYTVWLSATNQEAPVWLLGVLAVFTFLSAASSRLAQANLTPDASTEEPDANVKLHWKK